MFMRTCFAIATLTCLVLSAPEASAQKDVLSVSDSLTGLGDGWATVIVYVPEGSHTDEHGRRLTIYYNLQRQIAAKQGSSASTAADDMTSGEVQGVAYAVMEGAVVAQSTFQLGVSDNMKTGSIDHGTVGFELTGSDGRIIQLRLRLRLDAAN